MSPNSRYTSAINRGFRSGVQVLTLKPFIWSLVRVEVHGLEHFETLPTDQAFIMVSNHCSHLDTPILFGGMPQRLSSRLATGAAADFFFKHWYTALSPTLFFNAFPVQRASQETTATDRHRRGLAGQLLAEGVPLLIFPEGTRSRTGAMSAFQPGSAALAISHVVPIVPAALVGTWAAWPASAQRWKGGRPPVHLAFGPPMWPHTGEMPSPFNDRVRAAVTQLHDTTAAAYGMPTQAELLARAANLNPQPRHQP